MADALQENPETLLQKRTIAILGLFLVSIAPSVSWISLGCQSGVSAGRPCGMASRCLAYMW